MTEYEIISRRIGYKVVGIRVLKDNVNVCNDCQFLDKNCKHCYLFNKSLIKLYIRDGFVGNLRCNKCYKVFNGGRIEFKEEQGDS